MYKKLVAVGAKVDLAGVEKNKEIKNILSGNVLGKIANELNISLETVQSNFKESFNSAAFLYLLAEIFEEKNEASISKLLQILYKEQDFANAINEIISIITESKSAPIPSRIFENMQMRSFNDILVQIENLSTEKAKVIIKDEPSMNLDQISNTINLRIQHALTETLFTDLSNVEKNGFSVKLARCAGKPIEDVISVLEKNGFLTASRDIISMMRHLRVLQVSTAKSYGGIVDPNSNTSNSIINIGDRTQYLDTSKGLNELAKINAPEGVDITEFTPTPKTNPNYLFSEYEIKWIEHYLEKVRESENKKGNCFSGKIGPTYDNFMKNDMPRIKTYLDEHFGKNWENLENMFITGIGGNDMLTHLIGTYSKYSNKNINVYNVTHPSLWDSVVGGNSNITGKNSLIIANTRSGDTHETDRTVKFIKAIFDTKGEETHIIGVTNSGKVAAAIKEVEGVDIHFPYGVAGRLSTFVTAVFLAPLSIIEPEKAEVLFKTAQDLDHKFSLNNPNSYAWLNAKKQFVHAFVNGGEIDYMLSGNSKLTNDVFRLFIQDVMEGIKHPLKTLITKGLPDLAHHQIEQLQKFVGDYYGILVLDKHPIKSELRGVNLGELKVDGGNLNKDNIGLSLAQLNTLLGAPMSCTLVEDILEPKTQAFIFLLLEQSIYYLARMLGDSPENNPIVKDTRYFAAQYTKATRENDTPLETYFQNLLVSHTAQNKPV